MAIITIFVLEYSQLIASFLEWKSQIEFMEEL